MKTLILDNFDSFTYNLFQYCAELGANPVVFRNNEITLEEIERDKYTHLMISPGPGTPANEKDFGICGKVITHFAGRLPILGVCLGHQGIIHVLGGRVIRAPIPMHGKRSVIRVDTQNPLFRGLPEKIEVMRYHSLIGEAATLPKELDVIGETEDRLIMAVAHKNLAIYGVQFHPESVGTPLGKQILKNFFEATGGVPLPKTRITAHALTAEEAESFIDEIADGTATEDEIEDILLARKGESVAEITGMARGLRKHAIQLFSSGCELITMDTCGTGGSGLPRMNISTTAAFVLAAAGVKVAKHGNRAASGRCGSFDLLEALGVNIELAPEKTAEAVEKIGVGFLYAPTFHPVMKRVAPVRKRLGIRTIFNLLGPLVNPAHPKYHLLGAPSPDIAKKLIEAMRELEYVRAAVVCGQDGLDDLTLTGKTRVFELNRGVVREYEFAPEEAGLPRQKSFEEISGGSAQENARIFLELIQGHGPLPLKNLLLLNAGFAFFIREVVRDIHEGIILARNILESGAAYEKFTSYKNFTYGTL